MAKKPRRLSVTQQIMQEVDARLKAKNYPNHKTYRQFLKHCYRYVQYCREAFDCRDYASCCNLNYAKTYCDSLKLAGYSASTVHTFLAPLGVFDGIKLKDINNKPRRCTADYTRGRKDPFIPCKDNDVWHKDHEYLCTFQRLVGARKSELKKLTGSDLVLDSDESGSYSHWAVRIKVGKGGKKNQLNRLNKEDDIEIIRKYFEGKGPDELIFPPEAFKNHLNLHKLRAESAKDYYKIQVKKIKEDPEYAKQLEKEIIDRWNRDNINPKTGKPKYFDKRNITGYWVLRGKNVEKAKSLGWEEGRFLRIAVLATSLFKLSHFRLDVTCASYLLT